MTGGQRGPRQRTAQRPSERSRRAEPTRFAAFTLLRSVSEGAYANLELPAILRARRFDPRDAAFVTELAFGTLRWQGLYDAIIAQASGRAVGTLDPAVLDVLRLGAHQLLGMRVPQHAAADQTVGLARAVAGLGSSGFVNAVMRRISERPRAEWVDIVRPDEPLAGLAVEHSHPAWIVTALRAALIGHGTATADSVGEHLRALLTADNEAPRVTLVAKPGLLTQADLLELPEAQAGAFSPLAATVRSGDPGRFAIVRDGRAAVQDEGSQLVALALGAAPTLGEVPARWLDLCAGPGGKSAVLAGLAAAEGAEFRAVEVSDHRADLVRQSLRHFPAAAVTTADGRTMGETEPAAYGRILVDAPCTGLGALRRRPEARWRRSASDLTTLGPLQRELLASALDAVAPGGVVAYSTCSPHLAETIFVVKDVLKRRAEIEIVDARPLFTDPHGMPLPHLGDGPFVQLWPHLHDTDGMFFALLRKTD